MEDTSQNLGGYGPLDSSTENSIPVSSDGSENAPHPSSSSWGFRSKSLPKNAPSSAATTSGKFAPSAWARNFQTWTSNPKETTSTGNESKPGFNLFNNMGFGKQATLKIPFVEAPLESTSAPASPSVESGPFSSIKNGFLSTSRNAVKAVQTKARHMVSQNKRRYQEGGFDLDMAYITENIIAMGFPAGDMSSGFFGYVEGFYRNHMEEVIKFFETQHKGKYKVYNLCSERLYDASLFEGKVACFPFDDHNCPQLQLIYAFCLSAYTWLKGDLENVVVVHCKAGMARTGLMICCLLLYLKFFPTSEESISFYNQKRCVDGKGLILPSQLRYVKYFERVLWDYGGETPTGRKCILRGIRLHRCPYWVRPSLVVSDHNGVLFSTKKHPRTKDMMSEDIWFAAPRKGVMVFALPGERCIADLNGDFKVHFQDRHGDFYCWLNTNMMESRQLLTMADLDGFDKRRLPSPGFQVEIVVLDHDAPLPSKLRGEQSSTQSASDVQCGIMTNSKEVLAPRNASDVGLSETKNEGERDNVFTDSESEDHEDHPKAERTANKQSNRSGKGKDLVAIADTEKSAGSSPNSAGTFFMSGTFGDGLRNAMDRMGISQGAWTNAGVTKPLGRPSSPPDAADGSSVLRTTEECRTHGGVKAVVPKGGPPLSPLADNDSESSQQVLEVGDANKIVENLEKASESLGGKRVDFGDQRKGDVESPESLRGDSNKTYAREEVRVDPTVAPSDFKAIAVASAADASVFTFGDDEDYETEED